MSLEQYAYVAKNYLTNVFSFLFSSRVCHTMKTLSAKPPSSTANSSEYFVAQLMSHQPTYAPWRPHIKSGPSFLDTWRRVFVFDYKMGLKLRGWVTDLVPSLPFSALHARVFPSQFSVPRRITQVIN